MTPAHGTITSGTPQSKSICAPPTSCFKLKSYEWGQYSAFPPNQITTTFSFIEGSFIKADATLLIAPIAITYKGLSAEPSWAFFINSSTAGASITFLAEPTYSLTPLKTKFSWETFILSKSLNISS